MQIHKKYSVIIPTLNEEKHIASCIDNINKCLPGAEIIVTDGGSKDNTLQIATNKGTMILSSLNGRGNQLNLGAEKASSDILIFLHADTVLPKNSNSLIDNIFTNKKVQVATFKMNFDIDNRILNFYSWFTRFDSIFTRFGDCGIVVRKSYFKEGNHFPKWKLFEDVHFLRTARKKAGVFTVPEFVTTSARRFLQNGFIRTQLRNFVYIIQYLIYGKPKSLYSKYNKMKNFNKKAVIVFAKYPQKGKVKTRLASTLGERFAADFYKVCAEHTFKEILKVNKNDTRHFLFYSDENDKNKIRKWTHFKFLLFNQQGEDLGEKMLNAFHSVFKNDVSKSIIIGTDLPDISSYIINDAFELLNESDVVLGPATDGGYYLLGMKKIIKELFIELPWSTEKLFRQTLKVINDLNLQVSILPELSDIDTESDLNNWINKETNLKTGELKSFVKAELFYN